MAAYDPDTGKGAMAAAGPMELNNELHELLSLMKSSGKQRARVEVLCDPRARKDATDQIRKTLGYYGHKVLVYAGSSDIEIEVAA